MMNLTSNKLLWSLACLSFLLFLGTDNVLADDQEADFHSDFQFEKEVTLIEDGLWSEAVATEVETVKDFLAEQKVAVNEHDFVFPPLAGRVFPHSKIFVHHARTVTVLDGKIKQEFITTGLDVESVLWEAGIRLENDDVVEPVLFSLVNGGQIKITRVVIEEEVAEKNIDFKVVVKEDDKLGWREKKVEQKGQKGKEELKYRVIYHNGKEISRKIVERTVTKQPTDEIVTQGTYVKLGKKHDGLGSWYAFTGTMSAANPWLPIGSYVKVTNVSNGKSVIVRINDRGPFGKGRIIDLDKVAFEKLASLGTGIIKVVMEEVIN